jgi:4-hydroxy-tetrahydrodipicolinate synthase
MAEKTFNGGAWPVMLTPFTAGGRSVDHEALAELTDWYIKNGCSGLFSDCQSSEIFFLSLEERVQVLKTVIKAAAGRVGVVASGHVSDSLEDQIKELNAIADCGPDAVILITNRFAGQGDDDAEWMRNLEKVMAALPSDMPLGVYECPFPYKRLLSDDMVRRLADYGRFHFIKDTCCDLKTLERRARITRGSPLHIYNANSTTLLDSLNAGCSGFCGVMASFQMRLYAWLCANPGDLRARAVSDLLSVTSLIERQCYPINAKYYLHRYEGLKIGEDSRVRDASGMTETFRDEVRALRDLTRRTAESLGLPV